MSTDNTRHIARAGNEGVDAPAILTMPTVNLEAYIHRRLGAMLAEAVLLDTCDELHTPPEIREQLLGEHRAKYATVAQGCECEGDSGDVFTTRHIARAGYPGTLRRFIEYLEENEPCRMCGKVKPINEWCDCPEALEARRQSDLMDTWQSLVCPTCEQGPKQCTCTVDGRDE